MIQPNDDLINEVRTVQKQTKRMAQKLVESGIFPRGGEYATFFITLNTLYYYVVDDLIERLYGAVQPPLIGGTPDKPGSAAGDLCEWVVNHLSK